MNILSLAAKDGAASHGDARPPASWRRKFLDGYLTVTTFESEEVVIPSGVNLPLVSSIGFPATTPAFPQQKAS